MKTFGAQQQFYLKHLKKQTETLRARFEELQKESLHKMDNLEVQLKAAYEDLQNLADELNRENSEDS